ncbi:MAG: hypothetical protein RLN62_04255 [Rickettsiales bacterium]
MPRLPQDEMPFPDIEQIKQDLEIIYFPEVKVIVYQQFEADLSEDTEVVEHGGRIKVNYVKNSKISTFIHVMLPEKNQRWVDEIFSRFESFGREYFGVDGLKIYHLVENRDELPWEEQWDEWDGDCDPWYKSVVVGGSGEGEPEIRLEEVPVVGAIEEMS